MSKLKKVQKLIELEAECLKHQQIKEKYEDLRSELKVKTDIFRHDEIDGIKLSEIKKVIEEKND